MSFSIMVVVAPVMILPPFCFYLPQFVLMWWGWAG